MFGPAAPGPAGRSPLVSLGTSVHPGNASDKQQEIKGSLARPKTISSFVWIHSSFSFFYYITSHPLPDLPATSGLTALSPAAAAARSSPSSSPRSSPPPGCLASRSLHPSPLHASSLGKNHLTPGERAMRVIVVR